METTRAGATSFEEGSKRIRGLAERPNGMATLNVHNVDICAVKPQTVLDEMT